MKSIRFTKPLSLFFITSLLGYAEPLISYSHNAASTTPDFVFDGLASSASLGGGISGTNLASIPQISANQNDGLAPGSSKSPSVTNRDWFSYSVSSSNTNIMFETVELTVSSGANGPRLYDLRYMDSNGVEHVVASRVNVNAAGTESFSMPSPTNDVTEFRVYIYDRVANTNSGSRGGVNDFTVTGSVASSDAGAVVYPYMGIAELRYLQAEDGSDGEDIGTVVRQLMVDSGTYSEGAILPLGGFKEGAVHKITVNTSNSDSTLVAEFSVVNEGSEVELVNFAQAGAAVIQLSNAGASSLSNALELALQVPASLGDVTITHFAASPDTWADTQYDSGHFLTLEEDSRLKLQPQGDVSMGEFGQ